MPENLHGTSMLNTDVEMRRSHSVPCKPHGLNERSLLDDGMVHTVLPSGLNHVVPIDGEGL